jgi:hypothetical protein
LSITEPVLGGSASASITKNHLDKIWKIF